MLALRCFVFEIFTPRPLMCLRLFFGADTHLWLNTLHTFNASVCSAENFVEPDRTKTAKRTKKKKTKLRKIQIKLEIWCSNNCNEIFRWIFCCRFSFRPLFFFLFHICLFVWVRVWIRKQWKISSRCTNYEHIYQLVHAAHFVRLAKLRSLERRVPAGMGACAFVWQ